MQGFRNDLQEAMDQVDQEYLDDLFKSKSSENETKLSSRSQKPSVTYEEICEMAKKMGRGNREHDMTTIVYFIQVSNEFKYQQLQLKIPLIFCLSSV